MVGVVDGFLFGLAVPWFTSENYFSHIWEAVTVPACPWPKGRHEKLLRSIRPTFLVIWNLSKVITRNLLRSFVIHSAVSRWPRGGVLCLRPFTRCCFLPMELPVPARSVLVAEPCSQATEKSVHFFLVYISQGWLLLLITQRALTHTTLHPCVWVSLKSHLVSGCCPKAVLEATEVFHLPWFCSNYFLESAFLVAKPMWSLVDCGLYTCFLAFSPPGFFSSIQTGPILSTLDRGTAWLPMGSAAWCSSHTRCGTANGDSSFANQIGKL